MGRIVIRKHSTQEKKSLADRRKKALERIERLADHALESGPATPLTHEDFEEIRRRLRKKHGHRNGRAK